MRIIFCDSGFSRKEVDYMYAEEYKAAKSASLDISLISFEDLQKGETQSALKRVGQHPDMEMAIYRGWMLKPAEYARFYTGLLDRNIQLINSPVQYKYAHYLPENYETIRDFTPKTTFQRLEGDFNFNDFRQVLKGFGDRPVIVKDYVKSQKHYWAEACFIPQASNNEAAEAVVKRFLELQGPDLNEGLVFREFIELEELGTHVQSGMPLTKEFRLFIKDGKVIDTFYYWDEGDYQGLQPEIKSFLELIPRIKSNFFTMDIAKRKDGDWMIVELGDGQVAGLPENADKENFYQNLFIYSVAQTPVNLQILPK